VQHWHCSLVSNSIKITLISTKVHPIQYIVPLSESPMMVSSANSFFLNALSGAKRVWVTMTHFGVINAIAIKEEKSQCIVIMHFIQCWSLSFKVRTADHIVIVNWVYFIPAENHAEYYHKCHLQVLWIPQSQQESSSQNITNIIKKTIPYSLFGASAPSTCCSNSQAIPSTTTMKMYCDEAQAPPCVVHFVCQIGCSISPVSFYNQP